MFILRVRRRIVRSASGSEKSVEATEVDERGVERGIVSHALQRGFDPADRESLRDVCLEDVEYRNLTDDFSNHAHRLP
jgi:hypothetical protein